MCYGGAEEVVFLETHQDSRNNTPAASEGKPKYKSEILRLVFVATYMTTKRGLKKERVSNTPASHIVKKEMDNPTNAITRAMEEEI